jgi:predicted ATPase
MGEEQDFILLDEPEISLDIEWQEKLLSTIAKLVPNAQIIVASHSPSIMGDYFEESVEISICNE